MVFLVANEDDISVVCESIVLSLAVDSVVVDDVSSTVVLLLKSSISTVEVCMSIGTDDCVIVEV